MQEMDGVKGMLGELENVRVELENVKGERDQF